jgi:hypothetical protein
MAKDFKFDWLTRSEIQRLVSWPPDEIDQRLAELVGKGLMEEQPSTRGLLYRCVMPGLVKDAQRLQDAPKGAAQHELTRALDAWCREAGMTLLSVKRETLYRATIAFRTNDGATWLDTAEVAPHDRPNRDEIDDELFERLTASMSKR